MSSIFHFAAFASSVVRRIFRRGEKENDSQHLSERNEANSGMLEASEFPDLGNEFSFDGYISSLFPENVEIAGGRVPNLALQTQKYSGKSCDCSICLGEIGNNQEIYCLPCGHKFHSSKCLDNRTVIDWIREKRTCPCCRASV